MCSSSVADMHLFAEDSEGALTLAVQRRAASLDTDIEPPEVFTHHTNFPDCRNTKSLLPILSVGSTYLVTTKGPRCSTYSPKHLNRVL